MTRRLRGGYGRRQSGGEPSDEPKEPKEPEKKPSFWDMFAPNSTSSTPTSESSERNPESSENKVNEVIHKELVSLKESVETKLSELGEIQKQMEELVQSGEKVKDELIKLKGQRRKLNAMKDKSGDLENLDMDSESELSASDESSLGGPYIPDDFDVQVPQEHPSEIPFSEMKSPEPSDNFSPSEHEQPRTFSQPSPAPFSEPPAPFSQPPAPFSQPSPEPAPLSPPPAPLSPPPAPLSPPPAPFSQPSPESLSPPQLSSTPESPFSSAQPELFSPAATFSEPQFSEHQLPPPELGSQFSETTDTSPVSPVSPVSQSEYASAQSEFTRPQTPARGGSIRQRRRAYRRRSLRR